MGKAYPNFLKGTPVERLKGERVTSNMQKVFFDATATQQHLAFHGLN